MKALGLALLFTLGSSAALSAGNHPWNDISGCYITVERDGYPVESGDDVSASSRIQFEEKLMGGDVTDRQNRTLPGLELMLFQKYDEADQAFYMQFHVVPLGGKFSQKGNVRIHNVNAKLRLHQDGHFSDFTYIARTEVEKLADGKLRIQIKRQIPEVPDGSMNADEEYVLAKDPSPYCEVR